MTWRRQRTLAIRAFGRLVRLETRCSRHAVGSAHPHWDFGASVKHMRHERVVASVWAQPWTVTIVLCWAVRT